MKRVWCLYRVSTKQQVSVKDDLPVQREACRSFVEQKVGWQITNELFEKGVSGWSKRAEDREILQGLLDAAQKKEFDILLLYMLDRLGRREDELPLMMSILQEAGIEVWSVLEGQWRLENHTDKLVNYIRFWQAAGESVKTSARVKEAKRQLSAAGFFQGGTIPYGYTLVDSDSPHWKGKGRLQKRLVIQQEEALIVETIYDLYTKCFYGYRKIVDILTAKGFQNRKGMPFCISTIKRILENPIYIGTARASSLQAGVQPYNAQLQIISKELFDKAQTIQKSRQRNAGPELPKKWLQSSSKLLLNGLLYCGYCHSKLTGHFIYRNVAQRPIMRYQCPQNHGRLAHAHEQTIWSAKKYERIIQDEVIRYISQRDIKAIYTQIQQENTAEGEQTVQNKFRLKKQLHQYNEQTNKLLQEIPRAILNQSEFSASQLAEVLNSIEKKKQEIEVCIEKLKPHHNQLMTYEAFVESWPTLFEQAKQEQKKALLLSLIHRITMSKNTLHIEFYK